MGAKLVHHCRSFHHLRCDLRKGEIDESESVLLSTRRRVDHPVLPYDREGSSSSGEAGGEYVMMAFIMMILAVLVALWLADKIGLNAA
jgi:hypothetical protein